MCYLKIIKVNNNERNEMSGNFFFFFFDSCMKMIFSLLLKVIVYIGCICFIWYFLVDKVMKYCLYIDR